MKKLENYLPKFDECRLAEPAFCRAVCPFHLDVVGFVEKIRKGSFRAAYRSYRDAVCFPRVVSEICPAPCEGVCPLGSGAGGEPIDLPMLERRAVREAGGTAPNDYNIPLRDIRVAIVGAGLSGLGCALRLATRKYRVEIFEKTEAIGGADLGRLSRNVADTCRRDIEAQFANEDYALHLGCEVGSIESLAEQGFDAVYIATGNGGNGFGIATGFRIMERGEGRGVCVACGGALVGDEGVHALAAGLNMALAIDGWFKTGNMAYPEDSYETCAVLHPMTLAMAELRNPQDGDAGHYNNNNNNSSVGGGVAASGSGMDGNAGGNAGGDADGAVLEAGRCLKCKCNACELFCDLIGYTGKMPPRLREEVFATTLPGASEVKHLPAKRLMHLCTQCGVCTEVCPERIDIGGLILAGRQQMHRYGKAPWAFHEFFLRDMDHADGEAARFAFMPDAPEAGADRNVKSPPKPQTHTESAAPRRYAFFSGCQLGAGDPGLAMRTYEAIRNIDPAVGILARCCGAPAEWAGEDDRHSEKLASLRADWRDLGEPLLLMACPTCAREFREHMPEIPVSTVYEWLAGKSADGKIPLEAVASAELPPAQPWAVFDPCSAGADAGTKAAVRSLAHSAGIVTRELPIQSGIARCCGYGGQPEAADPAFSRKVASDRAGESELPYIAYCINCRDAFARAGKEAKHILEILFPDGEGCGEDAKSFRSQGADPEGDSAGDSAGQEQRLPTVTERRRNRERLKRSLHELVTGTEAKTVAPPPAPGAAGSETVTTVAATPASVSASPSTPPAQRYDFTLDIPGGLLQKMDEQRILVDDAYEVVDFMRRTGRSAKNRASGTHCGYRRIGHMTYWAEYSDEGAGRLALTNIYAHRMSIEMEQIWNGHKTREEFLSE
ncbi:MAG: NAD(P)-binding protein [Clostridiales Family XIII bacterium]|jgi:Fe-S oxidoreductase|nr:NAD(P)-binding protein [Clostridiales Family XIII bacterium]